MALKPFNLSDFRSPSPVLSGMLTSTVETLLGLSLVEPNAAIQVGI